MIVIIEFDANIVLTALRNKVMSVPFNLCGSFATGIGPNVFVERISFGTVTVVTQTRVTLPITVDLVTETQLALAGVGSSQTQAITVSILIDLSVTTVAGQEKGSDGKPTSAKLMLATTLSLGGAQQLPAVALQPLNAAIAAAQSPPVSVPLTNLNQALEIGINVAPSVVASFWPLPSSSSGAQVFAIRLDYTSPPDQGGAAAFMNGDIPLEISSKENVAILLSTDLISSQIEKSLRNAFSKGGAIDSALSPVWSSANAHPSVSYSFDATVFGGCHIKLPLLGNIVVRDIDLSVSLTVDLSLPTSNTLATSGRLDYDLNDAEVVECAVVLGMLGAIVGLLVGAPFGPAGAVIGATAGEAAAATAVIIAASTQKIPNLSLRPNCSSSDDNKSFSCSTTLDVSTAFGRLTLSRLSGPKDGFLGLHGTVPVPAATRNAVIKGVTPFPFTTKVSGNCNDGFGIENTGFIRLDFGPEGNAPDVGLIGAVAVCTPMFIGAPPNLYQGVVTQDPQNRETVIGVRILEPGSSTSAPAPCRVLIQTSAGSREINMGTPLAPAAAELTKLQQEIVSKTANCKAAASIWAQLGRFNPQWGVDPWEAAVSTLSNVENVNGLSRFTILGSVTPINVNIVNDPSFSATIWSDAQGIAETGALTRLSVVLQSSAIEVREAASVRDPSEIRYTQALLMRQASLDLGGPVDRVSLSREMRAPLILVAQGERLLVISLEQPARPRLRDANAQPESLPTRVMQGDILTLHSGQFVRVTIGDAEEFVDLSDRLAVRRASSVVEIYGIGPSPTLIGSFPLDGRRIYPVGPSLGAKAVFARNPSGGGDVIDVSGGPRTGQVLARYSSDPWFLCAAQRGNLLVRCSVDGKLEIYKQLAFRRYSSKPGSLPPPAIEGRVPVSSLVRV